jgi:hypothetical protein
MEDASNKSEIVGESRVINVSTPQEKAHTKGKSQSSKRKRLALVVVAILVVASVAFLLFRSSGGSLVKQSYEDCVKECITQKESGEIDVPYGNCFEYCREELPTQ